MSEAWKDQIYQYLRRTPQSTQTVPNIGGAVRRPANCPAVRLTELLSTDARFRMWRDGNDSLLVYVGLEGASPPLGATPFAQGGRLTIQAVADQFTTFLDAFSEKDLVDCEDETSFRAAYESWRTLSEMRGAYEVVKDLLISRRIITVFGNKLILEPVNRRGRAANRIEAIRATLYGPNLFDNKGGLTVSEFCFDRDANGNAIVLKKGQRVSTIGYIQCDDSRGVTLTKLAPHHTHFKFRFFLATNGVANDDSFALLTFPLVMRPHERIGVAARFTAQTDRAVVNTNLRLSFKSNGTNYMIGRAVKIHIGDAAIRTMLAPVAPFQRRARPAASRQREEIIDGERPAGADTSNVAYKGPKGYDVPAPWKETCRLGEHVDQLTNARQALCAENMRDLYHKLVWTEELQMDKDIKGYSIDNKTLEVRGSFLVLEVPGLSEKRPSVLKGDSVIVHRPSQASATLTKYRGYVHTVERDRVCLKFDRRFHASYITNTPVNVEFTFNRMTLRIFHQGIDALTPALVNHLLPAVAAAPAVPAAAPELPAVAIQPVDRRLNEQQMLAVKRIVQRSNDASDCPYIIYGPPGTGKTSTMVEAIKQVGKHRPDEKILICAPSNTAADVLLRRLASSLPASELFRFNSYQRDPTTVDNVAYTHSLYDDAAKAFVFPTMASFQRYKYVVCTCAMAGKLTNYGIPRGYFGTVFVDEAGHGWEPEVVAAFAGLLDVDSSTASGQLILAGDPQQLGPIVRSNAVDDSHGGLSISLLERLITTHAAYRRDPDAYPTTAGYDPRVLTMLLNCYRCHPDILKLPNDLFYASLLVPAADRLTTHNLCNWPGLPTRNFPLIFHGIEGENVREANSPSWFNVAEVEQVWEYVKDLVDVHGVPAAEVAVIAPYHKQVMKITQLLRAGANRGRYNDIAVGSCEKMQGQERRVIIISAVRSSAEFLDADRYYNLGFVASPKRFNVAVTRAKALLIVIGNPNVLARDPCWGGLLNMCVARGGYRGCALSSNDPNAGPGGSGGPDGGPGGERDGGGPGGDNSAGDGAWSSDDEDGAPGGGAGAVHFAGVAPPAVGLQQLEEDLARLALAAAPAPSLNIPLLSQRGAGAAAQQVHGAAAFAEDDGADAAEGWERVDEVDWARTEL